MIRAAILSFMIIRSGVIALFLVCACAAGSFARLPGELEALEAVARLRQVEWGDLLPEYLSMEEAYSKGKAAARRNDSKEAERLFQMAILKGAILDRKALEANLFYPAAEDPGDSSRLVGEELVYTVRNRDTLRLVAAKFGISPSYIRRLNRLKAGEPLKAGQRLKIVTRRIVPKEIDQGMLINIPDRTMYLFRDGRLATMYPVAVGRPSAGQKRGWQTPTGSFSIVGKVKDPVWRVPPSIQEEMKSLGREVSEEVPPGVKNPLGRYALRTSIPGILIHGTNAPSSVYGFNSHGCIRVYPDNMEKLYRDVRVNMQGEILYKPVKVAEGEEGRIYLEVHPDVYGKVKNLEIEAWKVITSNNVNDRVDWDKVMRAVGSRSGIPVDVTRDIRIYQTLESGTSLRGSDG